MLPMRELLTFVLPTPTPHAVIGSGQIGESFGFSRTRKSHDIGNTVPALAKNAEDGPPTVSKQERKNKARKARPPV